jgi:hypothetical protein
MITVNFVKAQEITKQRLRRERKSIFAALDIEFQRAFENQSDTSAIIAEKQRLRDITLLVDDATTLEQLKAISV